MIKFISKLTTIIGLIGLAFLVHSCGSDSEEVPVGEDGKVVININDQSIYEDSEDIEIIIKDSKGTTVKTGNLTEMLEVSDCTNATASNGVILADLAPGDYTLTALEINGYYQFGSKGEIEFNITSNGCKLISLGNSSYPQEFLKGKVSFFADNTVGFTKQQITITITDKNDDEVETGHLRQYATNPNCGEESKTSVYTVYLPDGDFNVYAVEADLEDTQGAWFTGLEGYKMTVTIESCQRFKLGEDPFEERDNPNARLKGLSILSITAMQ
ncbi:hypothetical protein EI427_10385 [Flammeovirga pectinis]|uniref:DUF4382 domain-containing protein n=1 Tax=Flammeovirga pectinis TaxID=2494373 RepID=A0A3Q9FLS7_9BACT|nr:hypothetical protein [Flammeovirga pectinis]AZQ62630.1 hypothetical protein EI427_10385 [Flammeovirga pectinis]